MAVLKTLRQSRLPAQLLIITFLVGGLPAFSGVIVQPTEAAFTLNICHPIQGADHSFAGVSLVAPFPLRATAPSLADHGSVDEFYPLKRSLPAEAPIPPPPKIGV
jgi:hypothetical protein